MKNFIFDFGMVLVNFDTDYMTKAYIKNEADVNLAKEVIFDRLYWDKLDAGTITDREVKDGIKSRLPQRLWDDACKAYDNWYYNLPFIAGMPDLVREIKASGGKVYILSNISTTFAENYQNVPALKEFFSLFDGLVFSAKVGFTKPSAEIFEYVLDKYGLDRTETAFIDDSEKNVNGANAVGINGILFDGDAEKLKEQLL
jgi:putative hydrolase of the HAD superfamily